MTRKILKSIKDEGICGRWRYDPACSQDEISPSVQAEIRIVNHWILDTLSLNQTLTINLRPPLCTDSNCFNTLGDGLGDTTRFADVKSIKN